MKVWGYNDTRHSGAVAERGRVIMLGSPWLRRRSWIALGLAVLLGVAVLWWGGRARRAPKGQILKALSLFDDDETGKIVKRVAKELVSSMADEEL
jgi:hypothetical protein